MSNSKSIIQAALEAFRQTSPEEKRALVRKVAAELPTKRHDDIWVMGGVEDMGPFPPDESELVGFALIENIDKTFVYRPGPSLCVVGHESPSPYRSKEAA